jgi:predicted enzyme related to lactoylglutathione lyase
MANKHGDFIWYELMTAHPDAAGRFYGDVADWTVGERPPGEMDYRMISAPDGHVGGMLGLTKEMTQGGARPCWLGYVGVDDVDATVATATATGGKVLMPTRDLAGVGRIAMVTDPQGAPFYVMRGASDGTSHAYSPTAVGHCGWNELATTDQAAAFDFYGRLFGWTKGTVMPMGDMGDYSFLHHGGERIGAIMTRRPDGPPPMWAYYFRVADVASSAERAKAGGGRIMHGPVDVPGGDRIVIGADPEGAGFALVGN